MRQLIEQFKDDLCLLDKKAVFALVYTAAGLSCTYYLRNPEVLASVTRNTSLKSFGEFVAFNPENNLPGLTYWVVLVSLFYFVLPAITIKFLWREPVSKYGLNLNIERGFWKVYGVTAAIMLPLVYAMSLTNGFAAKYPFLRLYNGDPYIGQTLLIWELIYFFQFFGLEFFFRGFLVHSLKPALGIYSIFAMTVPYCMIHFGKPPAETISAIGAGIFLGWLSYRNGNIWLGLLLHCTVAFSMDIFALFNKGLL
ncbi:MAG TPA: CPBP family intramembrane glutamic endopeptidase [Pyrinomonadaceae bacterium]|nr:CPBP family intramembrane glutamic endopeptidase [Pyrinomonadaceae bacterium]